jgi:purine nucleosidase
LLDTWEISSVTKVKLLMSAETMKLVIDTDAGIDDAWAILMALAYCEATPGVQIIAMTTVHGNVSEAQVASNVCQILSQNFATDTGNYIPIYRGADRPLMGISTPSSASIMGEDGLGGYTQQLSAIFGCKLTRKPEAEIAAVALARLARQYPGELTILAIGPLTNLALAVRIDESFASNVARLVVMGGAVEGRGNASFSAEFNIFADPEAARIVFSSGFRDLWLFPWETCLKHPLPWEEFERLGAMTSPRAVFANGVMHSLAGILRNQFHSPGLLLPDPLTAAVCLDQTIATHAPYVPVGVDVQGLFGRGLTAVGWNTPPESPGNDAITVATHVVMAIDTQRAFDMLRTALM